MKTIMALVWLGVAIALVACAAPRREPIIETHEVGYPVAVKCRVALPVEPTPTITKGELGQGLYGRGSALLADYEALREYVKQLEPAIAKCIEPTPPPAPKTQ